MYGRLHGSYTRNGVRGDEKRKRSKRIFPSHDRTSRESARCPIPSGQLLTIRVVGEINALVCVARLSGMRLATRRRPSGSFRQILIDPSIAGPERFGPGSPATITPATKKDIAVGSSAVRAGTARMTLHHKYLSSRREITTWTELTTTCYALHNYSLKQWLHQCWALTPIALETKGGCPMSRRLHLTFILVRSKSEELWLGR